VAGRYKWIENFSDFIRTQRHDLPACSIVPQPSVLLHVPKTVTELVMFMSFSFLHCFASGQHMTLTGKLHSSFYFLYIVLMDKLTELHWKYIFKISLNRICISFTVVYECLCFLEICGFSNTELLNWWLFRSIPKKTNELGGP
jgi:hypothetical protein